MRTFTASQPANQQLGESEVTRTRVFQMSFKVGVYIANMAMFMYEAYFGSSYI